MLSNVVFIELWSELILNRIIIIYPITRTTDYTSVSTMFSQYYTYNTHTHHVLELCRALYYMVPDKQQAHYKRWRVLRNKRRHFPFNNLQFNKFNMLLYTLQKSLTYIKQIYFCYRFPNRQTSKYWNIDTCDESLFNFLFGEHDNTSTAQKDNLPNPQDLHFIHLRLLYFRTNNHDNEYWIFEDEISST